MTAWGQGKWSKEGVQGVSGQNYIYLGKMGLALPQRSRVTQDKSLRVENQAI